MQQITNEQSFNEYSNLVRQVKLLNLQAITQDMRALIVINPFSGFQLNNAIGAQQSQSMVKLNEQTFLVNIPMGISYVEQNLRQLIVQNLHPKANDNLILMIDYNRLNLMKDTLRNSLKSFLRNHNESLGSFAIIYDIPDIEIGMNRADSVIRDFISTIKNLDVPLFQFLEKIYESSKLILLTTSELKNKEIVLEKLKFIEESEERVDFQLIRQAIPDQINEYMKNQNRFQRGFIEIAKQIYEKIKEQSTSYTPYNTRRFNAFKNGVINTRQSINNFRIGVDNSNHLMDSLINLWDHFNTDEQIEENQEFDQLNRYMEIAEMSNQLNIGNQIILPQTQILTEEELNEIEKRIPSWQCCLQ